MSSQRTSLMRDVERFPVDIAFGVVLLAMLVVTLFFTSHYVAPSVPVTAVVPVSPAASPFITGRWPADQNLHVVASTSVVANGWKGSDFAIIGSYRHGDADTGRLRLRLHRNDRVLFRSGPTIEHQLLHIDGTPANAFSTALPVALYWITLDFTNPQLPPEFTVTFEDAGTGYGEWSAVALSAVRPMSEPSNLAK